MWNRITNSAGGLAAQKLESSGEESKGVDEKINTEQGEEDPTNHPQHTADTLQLGFLWEYLTSWTTSKADNTEVNLKHN